LADQVCQRGMSSIKFDHSLLAGFRTDDYAFASKAL
jgi:hypothetical protein